MAAVRALLMAGPKAASTAATMVDRRVAPMAGLKAAMTAASRAAYSVARKVGKTAD